MPWWGWIVVGAALLGAETVVLAAVDVAATLPFVGELQIFC